MQNSNRFWKMLMNTWRKKELERTGELCPECGSELVYRVGRYGKFISCINFQAVVIPKVKRKKKMQAMRFVRIAAAKMSDDKRSLWVFFSLQ